MKRVDLIPSLKILWKMYVRQKGEEEKAGVDTKQDIETMRERFRRAAERKTLEMVEEREPGGDDTSSCRKCGGAGWYWSEEAKFWNKTRALYVKAPGMVVCLCPAGTKKNKDVAVHGRPKEKKSTRL